ncbi:MAG: hypothetical protein U1E60_17190 [Reyranellaceae bacterium]
MSSNDLHYLELAEVSRRIRVGALSPVMLTEVMLERIDTVDGGSPTITLPGEFTAKGLPIAFQLVSRPLEEDLLLRAGHAFQLATDWHERRPPH